MSFLRINTSITNSWRTTVSALLQTLRRVSIVVEDTFSWGDFNPQPDWVVTSPDIYHARHLKIGKMMWASLSMSGTLTGGVITITTTIPYKAANITQWGLARLAIAGVEEVGLVQSYQDKLYIRRLNAVAFPAVFLSIDFNIFLEME